MGSWEMLFWKGSVVSVLTVRLNGYDIHGIQVLASLT